MTTFLFFVCTAAVFFGLGYFVSSHPDDTRAIVQKVKDSVARLFNRKKE